MALTHAVAAHAPRGLGQAGGKKAGGGGLSLESAAVTFPSARVGETTVAKVKIKNRSSADHTVEITALSGPFTIGQSSVEVKTGCYLSVPVQVTICRQI
jgi:hypothetical protein